MTTIVHSYNKKTKACSCFQPGCTLYQLVYPAFPPALLMDWDELYNHARKWAIERKGNTVATANAYAKWYAANYPDGSKDHSTAFEYWNSKERKARRS